MKCVATITGIRPDFIRMSAVFKKLDENFNHVMIHTGQHYDSALSEVFFQELGIRNPDYTLQCGKETKNHYEQLAYLATHLPPLMAKIKPDLILFLGDSNSVAVSFVLKKEGYMIGHIEAGMRSNDTRMFEEINRTICDHCSDILFVYHPDYKANLERENIRKNVYVVGNTIVEPFQKMQYLFQTPKREDCIWMDIHRPENFTYPNRLRAILRLGNDLAVHYGLPVRLLYFKRLMDALGGLELGAIQIHPLMSYTDYMESIYHAKVLISDSGTGQEEPALLKTPVIVPRDFTERPQSYEMGCSIRFSCDTPNIHDIVDWKPRMDTSWLGDGTTSTQIIDILQGWFYRNTLPYPHMYRDSFLNQEFARSIQQEILTIPRDAWDRYENPFEQKYTLRDKYAFPPLLASLFSQWESQEFVKQLSNLTGFSLKTDPTRNFWGVHTYNSGDKLDIHVDAGLHPITMQKKQITIGLYLSVNYEDSNGCALEIWDGTSAGVLSHKVASITPQFNRFIMFTCNDISWHGNPEPLTGDTAKRIFVTMSYLSDSTSDTNKLVKARFVKRPQDPEDIEKDILREKRCHPDKFKEIYKVIT